MQSLIIVATKALLFHPRARAPAEIILSSWIRALQRGASVIVTDELGPNEWAANCAESHGFDWLCYTRSGYTTSNRESNEGWYTCRSNIPAEERNRSIATTMHCLRSEIDSTVALALLTTTEYAEGNHLLSLLQRANFLCVVHVWDGTHFEQIL